MKMNFLTQICGGRQDGAVFGGFLFSFNHKGECTVYETAKLNMNGEGEAESLAEFVLDKNDMLCPHSNAVTFGNEYYAENDEFPLLYTNVYNNYSDKLKGACAVYRIQRQNNKFKSTLVQIIEIGFTDDENYWKSGNGFEDVRPYGNFTIDCEKGIYYAFTMRDGADKTRFFAFALPKCENGELWKPYNVKRVILQTSDIKDYFDCEYSHYIQGACCHEGKIYSLEGFTDDINNQPALRIIDTEKKKATAFIKFSDFGSNIEPEMIAFEKDTCYYTDHNGKMYNLIF